MGLPSFLSSFLPSFLPSFHPSFLPSFSLGSALLAALHPGQLPLVPFLQMHPVPLDCSLMALLRTKFLSLEPQHRSFLGPLMRLLLSLRRHCSCLAAQLEFLFFEVVMQLLLAQSLP